jgi:hypothetical protein
MKMHLEKYMGILLFLALFPTLRGQDSDISASLSRDTMLIGDQILYTISTPLNQHEQILIPSAQEISAGDTLLFLGNLSDTVKNESGEIVNHHFIITCFYPGEYIFPGFPLFRMNENELDTLYSNPVHLIVMAPKVDMEKDFKDIRALLNTPVNFQEILPWLIYGIGGFLLLTLLIALLWIAFNRKKVFAKQIPVVPPHIKAFSALDKLKKEKQWKEGKIKEYYTELSNTIRIYMEERYGIPAMESITTDILKDFKKYALDDDFLTEMLEALLNLSDLVKFAKEDPEAVENETNLNKAYIFVEKTKPVTLSEDQDKKEEE